MRVTIDGIIYQRQARGGISRLYSEILPRMCDIDCDLSITLFTDGPTLQPLPEHARISHRGTLAVRPEPRHLRLYERIPVPLRRLAGGAWNRVRNLWLDGGRDAIWHSTYYTVPARWQGCKVVTVYDMVHEKLPHLFPGPLEDVGRQRKRRCVETADLVISISESTRADLLDCYGIDGSLVVVTPLAAGEQFRQLGSPGAERALGIDQPYLLYVGMRSGHKNFTTLLRAFSEWELRSQVLLVVVGHLWIAREVEQLRKQGIQARIKLLSDIDDEALCVLYNGALALVLPSLYEGFGAPLVEAMACGCPIVASRIPSTLEVAGELPIYFDPEDAGSLIAALDRAVSEAGSSPRVGAGVDRARRYSWDETARRTLLAYESLVKSVRSPHGAVGR